MNLNIKLGIVIPVISYLVFMLNLYSNINLASIAFLIMVISIITLTIISFRGENVKESQRA